MQITLRHISKELVDVFCDQEHSHCFVLAPLAAPSDAEDDDNTYGKQLYQALFPDGSLASTALARETTRLKLICEGPASEAIPWERMVDPAAGTLLVQRMPLVRSYAGDEEQPAAPQGPGIEARSLEILEHNTVAVLTGAPERLAGWRGTLAHALEDTLERRPEDVAEIAFFRALLALLDGGQAKLPADHRYAPALGRIVELVNAARSPQPGTALLPEETLTSLIQGTAAAFAGAVNRDAWREGIEHALQDARQRGEAWSREVELFAAMAALLDGEPASLPEGHPYADALAAILAAVEAAQDPKVLATNAWLNAEQGEPLRQVWRAYEPVLRDPTFAQGLAAFVEHALGELDDPALAQRVRERLALLKEWLAEGPATQ